MFTMQAPYPALQTTSFFPNPEFGDSESLGVNVTIERAMDGTVYSYVKRKGRRILQWTFTLTRNKALELRAFFLSYYASRVKITDHQGREWVGYFTSNPFEFSTDAKASPAIDPMPRGEHQTITVEFEGVQQ
jgi:hypothetical protein